MKIFKIIKSNGELVCYVKANNERHALCVYLTCHEELNDIMLWQSMDSGMWKLAKYDCEEEFMFAKES